MKSEVGVAGNHTGEVSVQIAPGTMCSLQRLGKGSAAEVGYPSGCAGWMWVDVPAHEHPVVGKRNLEWGGRTCH